MHIHVYANRGWADPDILCFWAGVGGVGWGALTFMRNAFTETHFLLCSNLHHVTSKTHLVRYNLHHLASKHTWMLRFQPDHATSKTYVMLQVAGGRKVNPLLLACVRQWQWRQVMSHRDLLHKTGKRMYKKIQKGHEVKQKLAQWSKIQVLRYLKQNPAHFSNPSRDHFDVASQNALFWKNKVRLSPSTDVYIYMYNIYIIYTYLSLRVQVNTTATSHSAGFSPLCTARASSVSHWADVTIGAHSPGGHLHRSALGLGWGSNNVSTTTVLGQVNSWIQLWQFHWT